MSGGSWNYLYSSDIENLMNERKLNDLQDMADRLAGDGYTDIAKDVQRLVEYVRSAMVRIETLFEMLKPVLHAVEWYDSGDYGEEGMLKVFEEYRNCIKKPE